MVGYFPIVTILLIFLNCEQLDSTNDTLWCYQCNTDLKDGHRSECNDPFMITPLIELAACPLNESYSCLKSVVFYKNIFVTLRGCVPTRHIDYYCRHEKTFPHASIQCYFCNDYACNQQESVKSDALSIFCIAILLPITIWRILI